MARMPTIVVPGVPLHVSQLGATRKRFFFHPDDYAKYLLDLGEAAAVFGCAIHAYVLMPNHLHLLLTPAEPDGPARLMQALGRFYDEYLDRRYARRGTIGGNDLRVVALHSDREVPACSRRIELDPEVERLLRHRSRLRVSLRPAEASSG